MKPTVKAIRDMGSMGARRHLVVDVVYSGPGLEDQTMTVGFQGPSDGESSGPVLMMSGSSASTWVTDPGRFGPFGSEWVKRFYGQEDLT